MSHRTKPSYFDEVRASAARRWAQLDADPELAAPWHQLFRQVLSPRHVVSELLQNADDAGAERVRVYLREGTFFFEHDGKDFDKEDFASLCRFGYSNKRTLHTIGFRGVGFKSTFSLGDVVEVVSPSLAARFEKRHFTEPIWIPDALSSDTTRVSVKLKEPGAAAELRKNLEEWKRSPISLLFFASIQELTIEDLTVRKRVLGPGPVPGSQRIALEAATELQVLLIRSSPQPFPEEAMAEIRQERSAGEELTFPPCTVELILGLPDPQRLYVVLPTSVTLGMPFSCNAPFLQDPARTGLKSIALSPTNRWLLARLGRLAASAMLRWLENSSLPRPQRAEAYRLLPLEPTKGDSFPEDATHSIRQAFLETIGDKPLLLTTQGQVVKPGDCVAPPMVAYRVWDPPHLAKLFGDGKAVLSRFVTDDQRRRLAALACIEPSEERALVALEKAEAVPRPRSFRQLLQLWAAVQRLAAESPCFANYQLPGMPIVPVRGSSRLYPASKVVRLSKRGEDLSRAAWRFLRELLPLVDRSWVRRLEKPGSRKTEAFERARRLFRDLGLNTPRDVNSVADLAAKALASREKTTQEQWVSLAHVLAALDAKAPESFQYLTRDGTLKPPGALVLDIQDPEVEALLPESWLQAHALHEAYFQDSAFCSARRFREWAISEKSCLVPSVPLEPQSYEISSREQLERFLQARTGASSWGLILYSQLRFATVLDWRFPPEMTLNWKSREKQEPDIWARVFACLLSGPPWYWQRRRYAKVEESNYTHTREVTSRAKAAWLVTLGEHRCLFDQYQKPRYAPELLCRTPETEPFRQVLPFVHESLDTETTRELLQLLGVRDRPSDPAPLLDRLRALSQAPDAARLVGEVAKWYEALDKLLPSCDTPARDKIAQAFAQEPLILTADLDWVKASEVFRQRSSEDPELPTVHPAVAKLALWSQLGVPERPTFEALASWLGSLPRQVPLPADLARRVAAALRRFPRQIWETSRCWLALDGSWVPVEKLRFRLLPQDPAASLQLFPHLRSAVADCRMLPRELAGGEVFAPLPDLGAALELRLTRTPNLSEGAEKPWLAALGQAIARMRLEREGLTAEVRALGARLARTTWWPFDASSPLQITPYCQGTPAGPAQERLVLWRDHRLLVANLSLPRILDALVHELCAPFPTEIQQELQDAMRFCIERAPDAIREYMEVRFSLEAAAPDFPPVGQDEEAAEASETPTPEQQEPPLPFPSGSDATPGELAVDEEDTATVQAVTIHHRARERGDPFVRFAESQGFRWDPAKKVFLHRNGFFLKKIADDPPRWWKIDPNTGATLTLWVVKGSWERGLELPVEVWEQIQNSPEAHAIVLMDGAVPKAVGGRELVDMVRHQKLELYPSRYRLAPKSS